MNAFDVAGQNLLYGWAYPVAPGLTGIPSRLHVVGNPVDTTAQVYNDMSLVTKFAEGALASGAYDSLIAFYSTLGLSEEYVLRSNLRVENMRFAKELLHRELPFAQ